MSLVERTGPGALAAALTIWSLIVAPAVGFGTFFAAGGGAVGITLLLVLPPLLGGGAAFAAGLRWFSLVFVGFGLFGSGIAFLVLVLLAERAGVFAT